MFDKPDNCRIRAENTFIIYAKGLCSSTVFIHKWKNNLNIVLNGIFFSGDYIVILIIRGAEEDVYELLK